MKLKPVFEAVAKDYLVKFAKVSVNQEQEIASKYGILDIPVINFFWFFLNNNLNN